MQEIEVFAVGNHTDSAGRAREYVPAEVSEIADQDLAAAPVPLVAGHPATDDPALGWVEAIKLKGSKLFVSYDPDKLAPGIREFLSAPFKPFRRVSVRLWHPDHPSNPRPGKWGLAHVGLLGATAPAIPLTPAFESEEDSHLYTYTAMPETPTVPTEGAVIEPTETPVAPEPKAPDFSSSPEFAAMQSRLTELERKNQALALENAATQHRLKLSELERQFDAAASTRPELVAHKATQLEFLAALSKIQSPEFSAGGKDLAAFHLDFLASAFSEHDLTAPVVPAEEPVAIAPDFNAPPGMSVDPDAYALHQKVLAYAAENNVDYVTALGAVGGK
ncbi:hypothetical protein H6F46_12080 [Limnothrix sp. FACHB-1083]|uniref:hypothetical protein n=1 Tax=unclassified Limnothrix TaxID=2632864 RepID=UPI001680F826|nr:MULTISPECIES: hypothetical protein [unclassified Limnothrix]MBD2161429.1 hypothetical protein [Limnothrix sp. FACHB-1083]MBD2192060.1 hypothetical protein [Limnothrix sp. FACHB-1088]